MGSDLRRVCVLGCSGAGKRHVAREISARTGLPHVELDRYFWAPGWVEPDEESWRDRQRDLVVAPSWVLDGNDGSTYDERLPLADTVVLLDTPRWRCVVRIMVRRLRPRLLAALEALPPGIRVERLRTSRDVHRFLRTLTR